MLAWIHSECKRISALHKVWRFCPKHLFLGPRLVKIVCALAICSWNDGCSSLHCLVQRLELQSTLSSLHILQAQDLELLNRNVYKESSSAKLLQKACSRKHKGNEDNNEAQEGGKMYAAGEFGEHGLDLTIFPPCKKCRMEAASPDRCNLDQTIMYIYGV